MQDLSKYTVPTNLVGMPIPTTVVGMLVVKVLPVKVVGMLYVILSTKYKNIRTLHSFKNGSHKLDLQHINKLNL